MNIIQIQDRLKGMPKEAIIDYIQNPTGEVPTFLALGELERRKTMENKYTAMKPEATTVAEQIVQENMPMGLGAITPSEAMSPSTAMSPEAGIMQGMRQTPSSVAQPSSVMAADSGIANLPVPPPSFAGGGIVAFAEGDLVEVDDVNPYAPFLPNVGEMKPIAVPESYTPEEFLKEKEMYAERFGVDPEFYKKQAEDLRAEREGLAADRSEAANMALLKAGLGIAGGTSQFALENIKSGALPAIEAYGADIKDIKQQDRLLKDADRKLQQAQQAEARGDLQTARQLMQQREAMQLKVMELNLNTMAALAKAKGLTNDQFKVASEIMKNKFGERALQDWFQGNTSRYNEVFNRVLDDVAAGRLTIDSALGDIGARVTAAPGETATSTPTAKVVTQNGVKYQVQMDSTGNIIPGSAKPI
jgi:hypothetical protein